MAMSHADGNQASHRLIKKLAFMKEGSTRKFYVLSGVLADSQHYARFDCDGVPALDVSWR